MNKLAALPLLMLPACVEFDPGSLITETRVLGAKVEVQGDPERSSPRPGETANITFVIEGVEVDPVVSWSLAACRPNATSQDPCPDVLASSSGRGTTPNLQLVVPAASALGEARALRVTGMVCTRGELDATHTLCLGPDADGTPLTYDLAIARATDDENLQPSVQQTRFRFDGEVWREGSALAQGCMAQPELPQATAEEREHRITIELGPDTRELYVGLDGEALYEELQLSTFVSAGELQRQFSFVSPADDRERPTVELKWTAPELEHLNGAGDLGVRFLVLVRDGRGGLSRIERALCVVRSTSGHLSAVDDPRAPDTRPA